MLSYTRIGVALRAIVAVHSIRSIPFVGAQMVGTLRMGKLLYRLLRVAAFVPMFALLAEAVVPAGAQTIKATGTIGGSVIDIGSSLPVSNATIVLYRGESRIAEAKSDSIGTYSFPSAGAGVYHVEIRASGYISGRSSDVYITGSEQSANVRTTLSRSSEAGSALREIGRVGVSTSSLQTSSTVTQDISAERLSRQSYTRAADAIGTLPGITLRGLDSAIGDDIYADIRGLKSSETQVLIDGHPAGPIGVFGSTGGSNQYNSYNLDLSPFFSLRNIQVTYGAGALSSEWGTSALGGTIDFQTLNPTQKSQFTLQQGIGDQGRATTAISATGSGLNNKLGYVLSHGVQGVYGQFKPGLYQQTGLLGQDLSSAGLTDPGVLYPVSGNYLQRQDLAKLRFNLSSATNLTLAWYIASEFNDKTGNGDNDSYPFDTRLAIVQNGLGVNGGSLSTLPGPTASSPPLITCPQAQVAVKTNAGPACQSAAQFAAATSGPAGGGAYRYQTILNQDYDAKLSTRLGNNQISGDFFIDRFQTNTQRTANIDSNFLQSFGYLASDDIATASNNVFGFGTVNWHQRLDGDSLNNGQTIFNSKGSLGQSESSVYIRDDFTPIPQLSMFANVYLKNFSVNPDQNRLDPRLTLSYRASPRDVIRVSGARSTGEPSIYIVAGAPSYGSPGSTTYVCNGLTSVGNVSAPKVQPEDGKEIDVTYGHRFQGDSQIQLGVFNTNILNAIVQGTFALTGIPGAATDPNFLANFNNSSAGLGYASTQQARCGGALPTPANFAVQSNFNAGAERAQGLEVSGRFRANRRLFFDYYYDLQKVALYDIPTSILQGNVQLVNGGQVVGVPRNKAGLAVDVTDAHGIEARIDGTYFGSNNSLNGPPYAIFNGFLSKTFARGTTFNFGMQNMFNANAGAYGRFGDQVFVPENQFGTSQNSVQQFNNGAQTVERFFLPPRSFQFSVFQRV